MKRVYPIEEFCMSCGLCEVACATEHSESRNIVKAHKEEKIVPRNSVNRNQEEHVSFSLNCRHCEEPSCVEACITGAIDVGDDGIVLIDTERCVACWSCIMACPFGVIKRDPIRKVSTKCDLCVSTDREGPSCVSACPNRALVYEER